MKKKKEIKKKNKKFNQFIENLKNIHFLFRFIEKHDTGQEKIEA